MSIKDRIIEGSIPVTESGCWIWMRTVKQKGYGQIRVDGKMAAAHRVSYKEFIGEIPDGLFVLHKCDVPACVNPEHLFIGNNQDNMKDMIRKDRGKTLLNTASVKDIKRSLKRGILTVSELAKSYGVHYNVIYDISVGATWIDIGECYD